jgi:cold shock CspA family protein
VSEYFYGVPRRTLPVDRRVGTPVPERPGAKVLGHVTRLRVGQGFGFIRLRDGREIYFHRADVQQATFNSLRVGDAVRFELLDDRISGPRALQVDRQRG